MGINARSPIWRAAIASTFGLALCGVAAAAERSDAKPRLEGAAPGQEVLRLNFREAPVSAVLDYLSETVGLIIVREAPIEGQITVVSYKPLGIEEAIGLLNTALNERGYAAVRDGRRLTIVKREDAIKRSIPVRVGANPNAIPRTDEMVTQIIPVPHANAAQLLENLQPLLPVYAVATANESSNAIVLTDTQANIRHMVEIVRGLDIALTSGSSVKVYHLRLSKAADIAKVVSSLFPSTSNGQNGQTAANGLRFGPPSMPGGDGPGGPGMAEEQSSDSRQESTRVTAVADERSNSVVVSATKGAMSVVDALIEKLDTIAQSGIEVRAFALKFASSDDTATLINDMFASTSSSKSDTSSQNIMFAGGPFGPPPMEGGAAESGSAQQSSTEKTIHAVSDYRTNSVIVTAEPGRMKAVEQLVARLDANPGRQQKVFIYSLKNATASDLAAILQGMTSQSSSSAVQSSGQSSAAQTQSAESGSSSGNDMGGGGGSPMQGGGEGPGGP